jgi:hypothetical protein
MINNLIVVQANHAPSATPDTYTMLRRAAVVDVVVTNVNGTAETVTLLNGAVAISAALAPVNANNRCIRPGNGGLWTTAARNLNIGDVLTFTPSGANISFRAYAYLYAPSNV